MWILTDRVTWTQGSTRSRGARSWVVRARRPTRGVAPDPCRTPPNPIVPDFGLHRDGEDGPMTTDLTGDFELSEDEFDWDVFLPDPDESADRRGGRCARGRGRAGPGRLRFRLGGRAPRGRRAGERSGRRRTRRGRLRPHRRHGAPLLRGGDRGAGPDRVAEAQPVALEESETRSFRRNVKPKWKRRLESVLSCRSDEPVREDELTPEGELTAHERVRDLRPSASPRMPHAWGSAFTAVAEPDPESAAASRVGKVEPLQDLEPEMLFVADPDQDLAPDPEPGPDLEPEPELAPFSALAEPTAAAPRGVDGGSGTGHTDRPGADLGDGSGRARSGCRRRRARSLMRSTPTATSAAWSQPGNRRGRGAGSSPPPSCWPASSSSVVAAVLAVRALHHRRRQPRPRR